MGIKVIKNKFNKEPIGKIDLNKSVKITCDHCDSELEITEEDTHIGWLGAKYITCPCCGKESMVDEMNGITLTVDNVKFPVHFRRVDKMCAKDVSDEDIEKKIKRGIHYLRKNDSDFWYTSYGDLFLLILNYYEDEEYYVLVTKDWYETNVSFTQEDYDDTWTRLGDDRSW